MANFTKVWGSGGLAFNAPPGSANLTQLDTNVSKTINATDGSTHSPTGVITIGGSGLSVTGAFTASNIQSLALSASAGTFTGPAGSFVNLSGTQTIGGTTALTGTLNVNATTLLAGINTVSGPTTHSGLLSYSNAGGIAMTGTQPGPTDNPGANRIHAAGVCKAWVNVEDATGTITINDRFNVASVAVSGSYLRIDFLEPMANDDYTASITGLDGLPRFYAVENLGLTTTFMLVVVRDIAGTTLPPASSNIKMMVQVFGRQ